MKFDSSLEGKTIIINMKADSDGNVLIQKVGNFHDPRNENSSSSDFDTNFTASILWNFYDAKTVTLGTGMDFGQFQGTILVPNGHLTVKVPGTNGRLIVGGDVTQDYHGGEFHSYEFDPVCPLPLPDCTDPAPSTGAFSGTPSVSAGASDLSSGTPSVSAGASNPSSRTPSVAASLSSSHSSMPSLSTFFRIVLVVQFACAFSNSF